MDTWCCELLGHLKPLHGFAEDHCLFPITVFSVPNCWFMIVGGGFAIHHQIWEPVSNTATELEMDRLQNLHSEYVPLCWGPFWKSSIAQACTIVSLEKCEKIYLKRHKLRGFRAALVCTLGKSRLRDWEIWWVSLKTSRKIGNGKGSSLGNQQVNIGDL